MNLFEFEGKQLLTQYGVHIPNGRFLSREDIEQGTYAIDELPEKLVGKVQILSGKRGKSSGVVFFEKDQIKNVLPSLLDVAINGQYVIGVLVEDCISIKKEHYLSVIYNTKTAMPQLVYSPQGGVDIEDAPTENLLQIDCQIGEPPDVSRLPEGVQEIAKHVVDCFVQEEARQIEINPLVETEDGQFVAVDAKIALDQDAFPRHEERHFPPRSMMGRLPTERELAATNIDAGEKYYQGTAGKYIEMDGDIAVMFSGGGASIAAMDSLIAAGLSPANYTEYSGNPPREKVYKLAKVVLSKPGLRAIWIAGAVANSTDIEQTFLGITDALDEMKNTLPVVIRRSGPHEAEGKEVMEACAVRNGFPLVIHGKEVGIDDTISDLLTLLSRQT